MAKPTDAEVNALIKAGSPRATEAIIEQSRVGERVERPTDRDGNEIRCRDCLGHDVEKVPDSRAKIADVDQTVYAFDPYWCYECKRMFLVFEKIDEKSEEWAKLPWFKSDLLV
jgi:hypothetical protein